MLITSTTGDNEPGKKWCEDCDAADPVIERFSSFDAYLDNADPSETIAVTPKMIAEAIALLPV